MMYLADLPLHVYLEEATLTDDTTKTMAQPVPNSDATVTQAERQHRIQRFRNLVSASQRLSVPGPRIR